MEELMLTIAKKLESKIHGLNFMNKIKNLNFKSHLPDTYCIAYKNNSNNITLLNKVYHHLLEEKLCRDQNIIQYVWMLYEYENKIKYFTLNDIS